MRGAAIGAIVGAAVLTAGWAANSGQEPVRAQSPPAQPAVGGNSLISWSTPSGDFQQVTVIDPQTRAMAVYHIRPAAGTPDGVEISLKAVRDLKWDLQIEAFNTRTPLPSEIRSMTMSKH